MWIDGQVINSSVCKVSCNVLNENISNAKTLPPKGKGLNYNSTFVRFEIVRK